jgi:predicted lipoprotein with Yx(FWY)xxD motif
MLNHFIRAASAAAALCIATTALAAAGAPASTAQTSKGAALVDAKGMSLYTFDNDAGGKSACNGPCAAIWPPLIAASGSSAAGDWTIVSRDDGSAQWAYKGHPLYTFTKDGKPGDVNGDGFKNVWRLAKP